MSVSKDENAEETGKVLNNCAYVEQDKTDQYAFNQSHSLDKKVIKSTKTTDGVTGSMTVDEKRKEDVSKASKVVSSKTKDLKNTSERGTPEKSEHLHPKESEDETTIKKSKQATKQASKDSDTKNMPQSKKHTPMSNVKIKRSGQNITRQPPEISRKDISKTKTKLSMSRITDEKFKPTVVRSSIDSDSKLISKSKFKDSNANLKRDNLGSNTSLTTTLKWKKSESITSETPTAFGSRNKIQRKTHESKSYTTENKNEADIKRSSSPAFVDKEKSKTKTDPSKNISKESNCSPSLTPKSIKEIDDKETQKIRAKAKLNDTERTSITTHKQKISVMKDKSVTPSSVSHLLTNKTSDVDTSKLAGECNTQKAPYLTTSSPSPAQFQQSMSISKSPVTKENQITSKGNDTIKVPRDGLSINSKNNELPLKKQRSNTRLENSSMQTEIKTSKDFKQSFLQRKAWVKSETDLKTETTVKRNETSQKCMIHETKTYFDENSQDKSPERDRAAESGRRGNEVPKTKKEKMNLEDFKTI
ncbi:mucin-4-like [Ruditapes philippinarum]|uniref:mucin-4-like n=1 Tax=Ruditapes philippinarum TaxID=129788 RepID=UPI00295BA92B|nr:mucin-4-like [Ruditapes philippinarum]